MNELLAHKDNGATIKVKIGNVIIGGGEKVIISGPCAVEDYSIMIDIALKLKALGVNILRGGAFKPRTSPHDFQGLQQEGLKILKAVGQETNIPVATEVMDTRDVELILKYADMLQIGSRNMYNYSLLKEVGRANVPVLIKRGMSATLKEWLYAAEYIMCEGNHQVVLCERGIRTFETYTRNTLDLNSVAAIKEQFRIPVIVDPSHGTGRRELVSKMSLAALAAGADGLIIESHINPDSSFSDAAQTINMDTLKHIIHDMKEFQKIF